jgi:hypothetical protein
MTSIFRISMVSGLLSATLAACDGHAAEAAEAPGQIDLETTVISGNEELPKVLYIVPWQAPERRPALPAPALAGAEDLFRPLRPDEHRRQILYLDQLPGAVPKE